jgi:hypothetical protein
LKTQPTNDTAPAEGALEGVLSELRRIQPGGEGQVMALAALAVTRALQDVASAVRENAAKEVVVRIAADHGEGR